MSDQHADPTTMKRFLAALAAAILVTAGGAYAAATLLEGTFALQGGTLATRAYLNATPVAERPSVWNFDFWLTKKGRPVPIDTYDFDMTKLMHVIVISDDFALFMHEHPAFNANGHFTMNQLFPQPGGYHAYFDGEPKGLGQQVFRFDVHAGTAAHRPLDLSERNATAHVDGYAVTLSGLSLHAGAQTQLLVHINENGKPATDLHPYLNALAHVVLIDAQDLTYIHVHPQELGRGPSGMTMVPSDMTVVPSTMLVPVTVKEPGIYKLWLQFRGGSSLHVASFVLTAA